MSDLSFLLVSVCWVLSGLSFPSSAFSDSALFSSPGHHPLTHARLVQYHLPSVTSELQLPQMVPLDQLTRLGGFQHQALSKPESDRLLLGRLRGPF